MESTLVSRWARTGKEVAESWQRAGGEWQRVAESWRRAIGELEESCWRAVGELAWQWAGRELAYETAESWRRAGRELTESSLRTWGELAEKSLLLSLKVSWPRARTILSESWRRACRELAESWLRVAESWQRNLWEITESEFHKRFFWRLCEFFWYSL